MIHNHEVTSSILVCATLEMRYLGKPKCLIFFVMLRVVQRIDVAFGLETTKNHLKKRLFRGKRQAGSLGLHMGR